MEAINAAVAAADESNRILRVIIAAHETAELGTLQDQAEGLCASAVQFRTLALEMQALVAAAGAAKHISAAADPEVPSQPELAASPAIEDDEAIIPVSITNDSPAASGSSGSDLASDQAVEVSATPAETTDGSSAPELASAPASATVSSSSPAAAIPEKKPVSAGWDASTDEKYDRLGYG